MGMKTPISASFNLPDGREVTIETGKLASLADGSCVVRVGNTMLFCSVVSQKEPREGASFFPLSGRLPGEIRLRRSYPRQLLPPRGTALPSTKFS